MKPTSHTTTSIPVPTMMCTAGDTNSRAGPVAALRAALVSFAVRHRGAVIGVVHGTRSQEDRVYAERGGPDAVSTPYVTASLNRLGLRTRLIDSSSDFFIDDVRRVDFVFINAHGTFGEDGRLQGLLDCIDKPYTGSGVLAGAVGVDKLMFKRVMAGSRIPVASYAVPRRSVRPLGHHEVEIARIPLPVLAKPVCGGSSLGMGLLGSYEDVTTVAQQDSAMILEEFLHGSSVTVAVLDGIGVTLASPAVAVEFPGTFYDEATKLGVDARSSAVLKAFDGPADVTERVQRTAVSVHELLGCRGFSRVDFLVRVDGEFVVLEINTIPGMTSGGNFMTCMKLMGLSYDETVLLMLRSSVLDHPTAA
jgi:D-alanine-D-alanine ligase